MSASMVPPLRASRSSVEEQLSRGGITVVGTNLVDNHGCSKAVSRWVRGKSGDMDRDSRLGDKDEGILRRRNYFLSTLGTVEGFA
jgi:hypothetical protein